MISIGQAVTNGVPGPGAGQIETPGVVDSYTFTATAGQRVYFDEQVNESCGARLWWRCVGPTNEVLFDEVFAAFGPCGASDPGLRTLTNGGTYTITVYGQGDATSAYAFNVWPVTNQSFAIALNDMIAYGRPLGGAGYVESPGVQDSFTFTAAAGQRVYFDEQANQSCGARLWWRCVGPAGDVLFDELFAAFGPCGASDPGLRTLTNGGTYTITVYGQGDATGPYQFTAWAVTNQFFTITADQRVTNGTPAVGAGAIETPGVQDSFAFTATAGQRVYFDELSNESCGARLWWRCVGPTNEVLFDELFAAFGPCGASDPGLRILTNGGTYTITVYGQGDATGPYAFKLWRELPLLLTQPQSQTRPVGDTVRMSVVAESLSPLSYQWRLFGTNLPGATNAALQLTNLQLSQDGPYDVVVANGIGAVTSLVASLTISTNVPDLRVAGLLGPAQAFPGQPIVVTWMLTNAGNRLATAPWHDAVLLAASPDGGNATLAGAYLNTNSLPAGAALAVQQSLIVPANLAGTFHLVLQADSTNAVAEGYGESNNVAVAVQSLQILPPDLIVERLTVSPAAEFGQTVNIAWTVRNAGTNPAYANWIDRLVLSGDTAIGNDRLLLDLVAPGPMAAGASYSRTQAVTLPLATGLNPGSYFVLAVADAGNAQAESNESNNSTNAPIALSLPPLPDLAVTNLTSPFYAIPGQVFELSWVVTNRGVAAANGVWAESISVSADTLPGNDHLLATLVWTNLLGAGASLARTQQVVYPSDAPAGEVHLVVVVDSFADVVEENETNNVALDTNILSVTPWLTLRLQTNFTAEGDAPVSVMLIRNGSLAEALFVTLSNTAPGELAAPPGMVIPAGQAWVTFTVNPMTDTVVDGLQLALLTASAPDYREDTQALYIADRNVPQLAFSIPEPNVVEGQTATASITRELVGTNALSVFFSTTSGGRLRPPDFVTIPPGQASASFTIFAVDDHAVGPTRTFSVQATAAGYADSSPVDVQVFDNDVPDLQLTFAQTTVSEGAGPQASFATVSRSLVRNTRLIVDLDNSNPGAALGPIQVIIPPGQTSLSFPVAAVNNALVDGVKQAVFTPFTVDPATDRRLAAGPPATLTVTDDDGPALTVVLARKLVPEGASPATTGTLSRNTGSNVALVVALASSETTEATVPASVTIPAGQSSATFGITSINDGVSDGNQTVVISASAPGLTTGSDTLVVSDVNLPDLVVSSISLPATAETDTFAGIGYRVVNQGQDSSTSNFLTRIFLSKDAVVGDDTLLAQYTFNGAIPPGQFFEQTLQVRLPTAAGNYWIVVSTDAGHAVTEVLEDNNTAIALAPLAVRAAYRATVQTPVETAPAGTAVPLAGRALRLGSEVPVPFVPVNIHLTVRGTRRIISALSDADGNFATTFTPLATEAGYYEIGAAHPGETAAAVQDSFTLLGMKAVLPDAPFQLIESLSRTGEVVFVNLSDLPLSGLNVSVLDGPANVSATASLSANTLAGFATNTLRVMLTAQDASIGQGLVRVRVSSSEGATLEVPVPVTIEPLHAQLVSDPASLLAGMKRGGQAVVEFSLTNPGGADSGPLNLMLPQLPWLKAASATPLASLAPGASNVVTLQLTPASDLPLGDYTGALVVQGSQTSLQIPFTFRCLSEALGSLRIIVEDELTYYAEGAPRVAGARVRVTDTVTGAVVTNSIVDAQGELHLEALPESYYDIAVTAEQHVSFNGRILLRPGLTNDVRAFVSRETVRYFWRVVPTEIEDRTKIVIETVFETFVPLPVVTIEPNYIDLAQITAEVTQIDLRISNHGLIAANEFRLGFSGHQDWSLTPLVSDVGPLPANSSLTVPLTIRRLTAFPQSGLRAASSGGGGACFINGGGIWTLICGTKKTYSTPVTVANAGGDCPPDGGGGSEGGTSRPGVYSSSPWFAMPTPCDEDDGDGDDDDDDDDDDDCEEETLEYNLDSVFKPLVDAAEVALNGAIQFNPYTRAFFEKAKLDFKAKGGARTCCDPETGFEIFGEMEGKGEVRIGPGKTEELSAGAIPVGVGQTVDVKGEFFFGAQAQPSIKLKADLSSGCDGKPKGKLTLTAEIPLQAGVKGEAQVKLRPITTAAGDEKGKVSGYVGGGITFEYTYDSQAGVSSCVKSQGVFAEVGVEVPQLGLVVSPYYPETKHYFVQPSVVCDPAGAPAPLPPEFAAAFDLALKQLQAQAQRKKAAALQAAASAPAAADQGGICARVRLRLDQDLVLTRNAFNASLELVNGDPLSSLDDITVQVSVLDTAGLPANDRFDFRTNGLAVMTSIDGTGVLAPASTGQASWILVPTREAAPASNTVYRVGGFLSYSQNGLRVTVPFTPVPITVQPDPRLVVKYFHQRDVFSDDPFTPLIEPSVPYSLAVMVQNRGKGVAKNVHITSAQPQIIENEKGLLIDFKIIGTEVAGRNLTPSLTVAVGPIAPDEISIGRWLLTSTLQGLFLSYQASIEHEAGALNQKLSLVDEVSIHEMIHLVQAPGAFEDNKPDFLVNEIPDPPLDLPDTLYLSDGTTNRVTLNTNATIAGTLSPGNLSVTLTAAPASDWVYLRVPDPGGSQFRLARVVRSDGVAISVGTNVWTTDRTFIGQGRKPRSENILHLLDYGSPGSYTLFYEAPVTFDSVPPSSSVAALAADSFAQFAVNWSGEDANGSGVAYFDVFVSENGGPFAPWIQQTRLNGSVYFGAVSNTYSFYSVAVDNSGNREPIPSTPDALTRVSRENHAPAFASIQNLTIIEGETLIVVPSVTDSDGDTLSFSLLGTPPPGVQLDTVSGRLRWATGIATGPSTNMLTIQVLDSGTPRLGSTRTFTVVVLDSNSAPLPIAAGPFTINEGQLLIVTNRVSDFDLPAQLITFALASGAPEGVTLEPQSGVLRWRPSELQGGTTNRLFIIATDNGNPPLAATQNVTVIVRDNLPDFRLSLGTTNLLVGQTNSIPVQLTTGLDLTNLAFTLSLPVPRLTGLLLQPLAVELESAVLQPDGANQSQIHFLAHAGQTLRGDRSIARLVFGTDTNEHSAIVPLLAAGLTSVLANGEAITNGAAFGGRVFLIGREPILDAYPGSNLAPQLVLYGQPGKTCAVETNLVPGNANSWGRCVVVTLTGTTTNVGGLRSDSPVAFYRAVELSAQPSLAILVEAGNKDVRVSLRGAAAPGYELQSSEDLIHWNSLGTNATGATGSNWLDHPAPAIRQRFYRAIQR